MQALKKEIIIDGIIYIPKIETKTETKKVGFQIKNRFT